MLVNTVKVDQFPILKGEHCFVKAAHSCSYISVLIGPDLRPSE